MTTTPPPRRLFNLEALKRCVIRGLHLKEGGGYFKKRLINMKFENFVTSSFQKTKNNSHYIY